MSSMAETSTAAPRAASTRSAPPAVAADTRLSPIVPLTLLTLITPAYFEIGTILLTPSRLLFLILIPILTVQLFAGRYGRMVLLDYLVYFKVFWMVLAIGYHAPSALISFAGMNITIILGGYLVGRCFIRSAVQFRKLSILFALIVVAMLPLAAMEAISGDLIIPPLIESLPGISSHDDVDYERRLGLDRAQVVFSHPIHFGLFCTLAFALVMIGLRRYLGVTTRWIMAAGVALSCFFSVSSGPILALVVQVALIGYAWITPRFAGRWKALIYGGGTIYFIMELIADRPAYLVVLTRLTFNQATAFNRQFLLEHGIVQIQRTPLLGKGMQPLDLPPWMPASIDNYWLADAVTYGLPVMLALLGGLIVHMVRVARRPLDPNGEMADMRLAWSISMVSLIATLATVAIWAEVTSTVYLMIAAGAWLLTAPEEGEGEAADATPAAPDPASRYTRFPVTARSG